MGLIRLFLALVVAADHLQAMKLAPEFGLYINFRLKLGLNAGFAVMWFFMISGFLMSTVLSEKYPPSRAGTRAFYTARFVRIFSLYWPLLIILMVVNPGARQIFIAASWHDELTTVFLLGADWRLSFADYPSLYFQALPVAIGQAWTLAAELTFYALAPFLLRSWKLAAGVLIASAATRAFCVAAVGGFDEHWTYVFFPATVVFFLLGHFARTAAIRWPAMLRPVVGFTLLALSFGALVFYGPVEWDDRRFWIAALCFAVALPGVFAATRDTHWLNALGDLSYPVYLTHIAATSYLIDLVPLSTLVERTGRSTTLIAAVLSLWLVAIAMVTHRLLEKPVGRFMRTATGAAINRYDRRLPRTALAARRADDVV